MYRTLIIILFLFFGKTVSATNHNTGYSFTQLSIQQGLSQPTVQSILLDERGTLWIGTKNGLNIYTQEGLKTYLHHSENPYSLPGNYINHIAEDSIGNIWVATQKGLSMYNYEQNNFTTVTPDAMYSSICVKGGIWFGGDNTICYYDYKD